MLSSAVSLRRGQRDQPDSDDGDVGSPDVSHEVVSSATEGIAKLRSERFDVLLLIFKCPSIRVSTCWTG